jgi:hypothetical protein
MCAACSARRSPEPRPPGVLPHAVRYRLVLKRPANVVLTPGRSLRIRSDLGYAVELTMARVASHSFALSRCTPVPPARRAGLWRELAGLSRARAGHDTVRDPSLLDGRMEDLLTSQSEIDAGTRALGGTRYCRFQYVLGAGTPTTRLRGGDAAAPSLALEGHFRSPDGVQHPLSVHSRLAHGLTRELTELAPHADGRALDLALERDLGSLFDGLALSELAPRDLARGVLRNLIDHSRVSARSR